MFLRVKANNVKHNFAMFNRTIKHFSRKKTKKKQKKLLRICIRQQALIFYYNHVHFQHFLKLLSYQHCAHFFLPIIFNGTWSNYNSLKNLRRWIKGEEKRSSCVSLLLSSSFLFYNQFLLPTTIVDYMAVKIWNSEELRLSENIPQLIYFD